MTNPHPTASRTIPRRLALATAFALVMGCRSEDPAPPPAPSVVPARLPSTLGGLPIPEAFPEELVARLTQAARDPAGTAAALAALGEAARPFAEALAGSPSLDDADVALRTLASLPAPPAGTDPISLGSLLAHTAPELRQAAVTVATRWGRADLLAPRLETRPLPIGERLAIVRALAASDAAPSTHALWRCVMDRDDPVAPACAIALTSTPRLRAASRDLAGRVEAALAADPVPAALLVAAARLPDAVPADRLAALAATAEAMVDKAGTHEALVAARLALEAEADEGGEALARRLLRAPSAEVRRLAVDLTTSAPIAREALADPDTTVRATAIGALGRLLPPSEIGPALGALLADPDETTRHAAVATVAALAPLDDAVRLLTSHLGEAALPTQLRILAALRTIPDRQAIDALIAALERPSMRSAAWMALVSLSGEEPEGSDPRIWERWRDSRYGSRTPAER